MNFFSSFEMSLHGDEDDGECAPEPWERPPDDVLGAVVPIEKPVVAGPNVALALTHARAYPQGVAFDIAIRARRGDLDEDRWAELESGFFDGPHRLVRRGRRSGMVRRFGVRFPDGTKAAVIGGEPADHEDVPDGPVLVALGGGGSGSEQAMESSETLWLWPLPPAEPFEFIIEWPLAGLAETVVEVDGAALVTAAGRARPYWPHG